MKKINKFTLISLFMLTWGHFALSQGQQQCVENELFECVLLKAEFKVNEYGGDSFPAIMKDQTVVVSSSKSVYFFNSNGTFRVKHELPTRVSPPLVVGGTVAISSLESIYFFNSNGVLKAKIEEDMVLVSPKLTLMDDETIIITSGDNYIYFLDIHSGTLKATFEAGGDLRAPAAIMKDKTVVFGATDGYVYFLNPDGTFKKKFKTKGRVMIAPTVTPDGLVVIGSNSNNDYDGYIYFLNPDGTLKEEFQMTGGSQYPSPAAVMKDGTIVIGSVDIYLDHDYVYFFNPNGTLKTSPKNYNAVQATPVIITDEDNETLVISSYDGYIYFLDSNGNEKDKFYTYGPIEETPAVMEDGNVVVSSRGYVYFLNPHEILRRKKEMSSLIGYLNESRLLNDEHSIESHNYGKTIEEELEQELLKLVGEFFDYGSCVNPKIIMSPYNSSSYGRMHIDEMTDHFLGDIYALDSGQKDFPHHIKKLSEIMNLLLLNDENSLVLYAGFADKIKTNSSTDCRAHQFRIFRKNGQLIRLNFQIK